MKKFKLIGFLVLTIFSFTSNLNLKAQGENANREFLDSREQSIIKISALTAAGDLPALESELNSGLESGLTVNEIREALVHLYAYCGFPRSIRGLQTFMKVLEERKNAGISDLPGRDASHIKESLPKYERGKKILEELTQTPQPATPGGYSAFAPVMDTFLKEHLFADIFERDVLTYTERELVTISTITAIGGAEPMLRSHMNICLNLGMNPDQLHEFVKIIQTTLGEKWAIPARNTLNEIINPE